MLSGPSPSRSAPLTKPAPKSALSSSVPDSPMPNSPDSTPDSCGLASGLSIRKPRSTACTTSRSVTIVHSSWVCRWTLTQSTDGPDGVICSRTSVMVTGLATVSPNGAGRDC